MGIVLTLIDASILEKLIVVKRKDHVANIAIKNNPTKYCEVPGMGVDFVAINDRQTSSSRETSPSSVHNRAGKHKQVPHPDQKAVTPVECD